MELISTDASIAVLNPTKGASFNDLKFLSISRLFKYNSAQDSYPFNGALYVTVSGPDSTDLEFFEIVTPLDDANSKWSYNKMTSFANSSQEFAYHAGMLDPPSNIQYGKYGFGYYNFKNDDYDSYKPAQWGLDRFKTSDAVNSTYNNVMLIDVDKNGNLYSAVNNIYKSDTSSRLPGVSKSIDNGKTWEEFDPMPKSIYTNYVSNAGDFDRAYIYAYQSDGFVVTGVDEWSFIYKIALIKNDTVQESHFVEAYKKNGAWGMRKVCDVLGDPFIIQNVSTDDTVLKDSLLRNNMGNEIQVSKTADGTCLVVKFVDFVEKFIKFNPALVINNGQTTLDSLLTTDIFFTARALTSDTWSELLNVTNDDLYNKVAWIPQVVPDLGHIPMISSQTKAFAYTTSPWTARNSYAAPAQQVIIDAQQMYMFSNVSIETGVESNPVPDYKFSLNDVYPNPVSGFAEVSFSLDKLANARLELFNALGQKVSTLFNANTIGFQSINVNTNNLPAGVYYYNLTVEGKSLTKVMSVINK